MNPTPTLAVLAQAVLLGTLIAGCAASGTPATPTLGAGPTAQATPRPAQAAPSPAQGGTACPDDDPLVDQLPPVVAAYGLAWNETDAAARLSLIEEALAQDGTYRHHQIDDVVVGRDGYSGAIADFQTAFPGHYFQVRAWAPTDRHHDRVQLRWRQCNADGNVELEGSDYLVIGPDGLVAEAANFDDEP
jgi:hypothetical protein